MAEKLNDSTFDAYINENELPVLADFYNDSCIPCKRISPIISKAETRYNGKMNFVKVNCLMSPKLVEKYEITSAPTLILFADKKEVCRHSGVISEDDFDLFIKNSVKGE
ncbi:MAG: thioredoxin family protein [Clostridiales bacterium]|nr:thioredoxin family protein [Clostridiales bacterium]